MYNKIQFSANDLNTMYTAGLLHAREKFGVGQKSQTVSKDAIKDTSVVDNLFIDDTEGGQLKKVLGGKSSYKPATTDTASTKNAGTDSSVQDTELSNSRAIGGVATESSTGKALGSIIGIGSALLGFGALTGAAVKLGEQYDKKEQLLNEAEAERQRVAIQELIGNSTTTDYAREPGKPLATGANESDSESRSNSQGF